MDEGSAPQRPGPDVRSARGRPPRPGHGVADPRREGMPFEDRYPAKPTDSSPFTAERDAGGATIESPSLCASRPGEVHAGEAGSERTDVARINIRCKFDGLMPVSSMQRRPASRTPELPDDERPPETAVASKSR